MNEVSKKSDVALDIPEELKRTGAVVQIAKDVGKEVLGETKAVA